MSKDDWEPIASIYNTNPDEGFPSDEVRLQYDKPGLLLPWHTSGDKAEPPKTASE
jgi:hypothetical protein